MAVIKCRDQDLETNDLDIFCSSSIVVQSLVLATFISVVLFGIFIRNGILIAIGLVLFFNLIYFGYLAFNRDLERGKFIGIQGETLFIRTAGGRESIVATEEIDRIVHYMGNQYAFQIQLLNGGKVLLPSFSVTYSPAYRWLGKNVDCVKSIFFGNG